MLDNMQEKTKKKQNDIKPLETHHLLGAFGML
jgi:hypothetical protein